MDKRDRHTAFADARGNALHGTRANVAHGENARNRGFQ
jgi:hypothetical protein